MADQELISYLHSVIRSTRDRAKENLCRGAVYNNVIEAMNFCHGALVSVDSESDDPDFLREFLFGVERARQIYLNTSYDEDGYGNASFLKMIQDTQLILGSFTAIEEYVRQTEEPIAHSDLIN